MSDIDMEYFHIGEEDFVNTKLLRALVERWRVKAKYYKNQDWWAEAGRVDDCADELEAIYKEVEK